MCLFIILVSVLVLMVKMERESSSASSNFPFPQSDDAAGTLQSLITNIHFHSPSPFDFSLPPLMNSPYHQLISPFNIINSASSMQDLTLPPFHDSINHHLHLPNLHSMESNSKRPRVSQHSSSGAGPSHNNQTARHRRQKQSEKTRCLQKLMPWDKKMDTATTLDEAYKYVQFLQAQAMALQSMPCVSSFVSNTNPGAGEGAHGGRFVGGLWRLNRQQLLQVLMNSPEAQTLIYSRGLCVFSMEQLVLLKDVAGRKAAAFRRN